MLLLPRVYKHFRVCKHYCLQKYIAILEFNYLTINYLIVIVYKVYKVYKKL